MLMARSERTNTMAGELGVIAETTASNLNQQQSLEDQLATIITAARNVAVVAEELLREVAHTGSLNNATPHAVSMAPRLLAATEQQLASVAAMLRKS
jgi:hypothetical protein